MNYHAHMQKHQYMQASSYTQWATIMDEQTSLIIPVVKSVTTDQIWVTQMILQVSL